MKGRTKDKKMDAHYVEQFIENVQFLRDTGSTDEHIIKRLGVSRDVFEKRLERAGIPLARDKDTET